MREDDDVVFSVKLRDKVITVEVLPRPGHPNVTGLIRLVTLPIVAYDSTHPVELPLCIHVHVAQMVEHWIRTLESAGV